MDRKTKIQITVKEGIKALCCLLCLSHTLQKDTNKFNKITCKMFYINPMWMDLVISRMVRTFELGTFVGKDLFILPKRFGPMFRVVNKQGSLQTRVARGSD